MSSVQDAEKEQVENNKDSAAFAFVRVLAEDISTGEFNLPSWPAVVLQIRRALGNVDTDIQDVVRLIGSDPVLAARVLKVANSAFYGARRPVSDLRSAVNRLGFDMVRNLAISLAMNQIFHGQPNDQIKPYLQDLWSHSTTVAALSFCLAEKVTSINADEAFLAGLVHDIGKFYVLMRAQGNDQLFDSSDSLLEIMNDWHTSIGGAIVESWNFSDELLKAVKEHELYDQERRGLPTLSDVVALANLLANQAENPTAGEIGLPVDLNDLACCRRLGLDADSCMEIMSASREDVRSLRESLRV